MTNKLGNKKTFENLIRDGRPFQKTVKYLCACEGVSLIDISISLGIAPVVVSHTLSGDRVNKKVVSAITKILGFNPWEVIN